jgi:hypothetical protein
LEDPSLLFLTSYHVLRAADDQRAAAVLEAGYKLLQERAVKISDREMRRSFLENVPSHREIIEAYWSLR